MTKLVKVQIHHNRDVYYAVCTAMKEEVLLIIYLCFYLNP